MKLNIQMDKSDFRKIIWENALERLDKKQDALFNTNDPVKQHQMTIQGILYVVKANRYIPGSLLYTLSDMELESIFMAKLQWLDSIKELTFAEFVQIFPIRKEFDGYKYEVKDYFTTIAYIESCGGMDQFIQHPFELLIEYNNFELSIFTVDIICIMDEIRSRKTGMNLIEEFLATK